MVTDAWWRGWILGGGGAWGWSVRVARRPDNVGPRKGAGRFAEGVQVHSCPSSSGMVRKEPLFPQPPKINFQFNHFFLLSAYYVPGVGSWCRKPDPMPALRGLTVLGGGGWALANTCLPTWKITAVTRAP